MIEFKDFAPAMKDRGGLLRAPSMEGLREALERANQWIETHRIEVFNVETVVMPNIHFPYEEGSEDPLAATGEGGGYWHQFIRVWHRK